MREPDPPHLSGDCLVAARQRIELAYDPELARTAGHRMIDLLSDHLDQVEHGDGAVLPWCDPPENVALARQVLSAHLTQPLDRDQLLSKFEQLVVQMLDRGHHLHNPRYIGHQVAVPSPLGGLFDAVAAITNQAMAIYEMGPWASAAEWAIIDTLGQKIGWPSGRFAGLATHGGSLANVTALLTARNVSLPDCWQCGLADRDAAPVLVAHADAHYSVARSAGVLGLGTDQVVRVGLDPRRRMDPQQLDETLTRLRGQRRPVIAVVACACSTPIGAFDPLPEIAAVCRRHHVWLHVDSAHGGSACLTARYRHLVAGLDQADSLIWDAHKTLFVPALCALVFVRNREHRFEAFRQDAPYLFDPTAPGLAEYDSGMRTLECTKRAAAIALWGMWAVFGQQLFADMVDVTFALGRTLYEKLTAAPDFEPLHEPQCNIVVFRHIPASLRDAPPERLGQFQLELRRRVIESGEFYIVSTKLDGVGALRTTIMNPLTDSDHLDQLLDSLRRHGQTLLAN